MLRREAQGCGCVAAEVVAALCTKLINSLNHLKYPGAPSFALLRRMELTSPIVPSYPATNSIHPGRACVHACHKAAPKKRYHSAEGRRPTTPNTQVPHPSRFCEGWGVQIQSLPQSHKFRP